MIRRAAELQFDAGEVGEGPLTEREVFRIGREVGLEGRHVRRALAEVRAEALVPAPAAGGSWAERLWGPGAVQVRRVVPGDAARVQETMERHFREHESLREVRNRPGHSLWAPSEDLVSKMKRSLDVGGRGYELASARQVELAVADLEEGWSLAALTLDLRNLRTEQAVGWGAGSAGGLLTPALALALAGGFPWLVVPAAAAATAVASIRGAGWSYGKKLRNVELAAEGLLDRLERGAPLEPERAGWRRRLGV